MPAFCSRCGAQVTGAFCGNCGASQATPFPSAVPAAQSPPPAAQGSPILKIVLVVFAVLMLLGVLTTAGLFYAGYKIKQKVEQTAAEKGIDLKALRSEMTRPSRSSESTGRDGCALLPKDEAQRIVGFAISRIDGAPGTGDASEHCDYYGSSAEVAGKSKQQMDKAMEMAKKDRAGDHPEDAAKFGEAFLKGLSSNAKAAQGEETQLFKFHLQRGEGRTQMAIIKTSVSAVAGQNSGLTKVDGLGDEALLGPMNIALWVRNGDDFVAVELGSLPEAKDKGIEIARQILSRL